MKVYFLKNKEELHLPEELIDYMNKLEYENDNIQIYCNDAYRYMFVQFRGNPSFSQFMISIQEVFDAMNYKKIKYLIADVRQWDSDSDQSKEWRDDFLLRPLVENGLKKYAIICNNEFQVNTGTHLQMDSKSVWQIKLRYYTSFEEAEDWILRID